MVSLPDLTDQAVLLALGEHCPEKAYGGSIVGCILKRAQSMPVPAASGDEQWDALVDAWLSETSSQLAAARTSPPTGAPTGAGSSKRSLALSLTHNEQLQIHNEQLQTKHQSQADGTVHGPPCTSVGRTGLPSMPEWRMTQEVDCNATGCCGERPSSCGSAMKHRSSAMKHRSAPELLQHGQQDELSLLDAVPERAHGGAYVHTMLQMLGSISDEQLGGQL